MVADPGGALCSCGKRGCVMAYASGIGISRMVYEHVEGGVSTSLRDAMPPDGRRYCGIGLSIVVQVLGPEVIVIGGGLTHMGRLFMDPAILSMHEHTQSELLEFVRVLPWQLGTNLGVLGAAARVFAEYV